MTTHRGVRSLAFSFAALGGTAAVFPAVIPAMAAELGASSSALLPAIPALFTGLLIGVLSTSLAAGRFSLTWLLRGGAAAQAVGLALAACAPFPLWFVAGAAVAGFGFGIVEAAGTAAVRVIGAGGMPRALTTLTLLIGIVATATPVAVLAAATLGWTRLIPLLIALVQLGVAASVRGVPSAVSVTAPAADTDATSRPASSARRMQIAFLAAALFCYVGTESVLSGWSASTFERELGTSAAVAALGTSAFWLLVSLGRMAGVAGTGVIPPGRLALGCTLVVAASLCAAAMLQETRPLGALVGLGVAVFASGPCYGLLMGIAVERIPKQYAVRASSGFVALGAAGGAAIPFIAASVSLSSGARTATTTAAIAGMALCGLVVASLAWRATPASLHPAEQSARGER